MTQPGFAAGFGYQAQPESIGSFKAAGAALAQTLLQPVDRLQFSEQTAMRGVAHRIFQRARNSAALERSCVIDNAHLIRAAEQAVKQLHDGIDRLAAAKSTRTPDRVLWIGRTYLEHSGFSFAEETCIAYLRGFQSISPLDLEEISLVPLVLQAELLGQFEMAPAELWPDRILSLRKVSETRWQDVFDAVNPVDPILDQDPAGAYSQMDDESRASYRSIIANLALRCPEPERDIAEIVLKLARDAQSPNMDSPVARRRAHVGYYLIDNGRERLETLVGYRPTLRDRVSHAVLRSPARSYFTSIIVLTAVVVLAILAFAAKSPMLVLWLVLLAIPASQAALDVLHGAFSFLLQPRVLPKLDFSRGIPDDHATLVAVPALLLNQEQVQELVRDLEIRFLANRDPNLSFALITDLPDADKQIDEHGALVDLCRGLIDNLNWHYPGSPFLLLHRERFYNESEGCWMGWERKRGKLLELNRLLRGAGDAFPVKTGNVALLNRIRYVITLDSDTQLPRDAAAKLIGAMAHPLNAPVIHPKTRTVIEGYGILQPRISVSIYSHARSRLAALCSGETGFDIYTCAVSDLYQDLFGEGIFTGKGIYDVDAIREVLESRFPENALLSHDLIEGIFARAGLVSDIELVDDYPSHFGSYSSRKHRWVRGDWQLLPWLFGSAPDRDKRPAPNPISPVSKWKIADNLRRSLFMPSLLALLVLGWMIPGVSFVATCTAFAILLFPAYFELLLSAIHAPHERRKLAPWARNTLRQLWNSHRIALFNLIFLLNQALVCTDAIVRTLVRLYVKKRKLLEWQTAAESERGAHHRTPVEKCLYWTPTICAGLFLSILIVHAASLPFAFPVLLLWMFSPAVADWLGRSPSARKSSLTADDVQWFRENGKRICQFYTDWSSPATEWLIPDSVDADGQAELRLSPTNLGMLLNARIAAVHLGMTTLPQFVYETRQTLATVQKLPKYRGHLLNWYDISTLQPMPSLFVSSVDSGNLAAALWTLKQAALAFAVKHQDVTCELQDIAYLCDRIVRDMDFEFLYNSRRRALSIGFDVTRNSLDPACYDLLASEARIAVFVAIAKGDIPREAWLQLGRRHTACEEDVALASWTGSMFEYLMPWLWMRHHSGTITERSGHAAVSVQRRFGHRNRLPWGISEAAHRSARGEIAYGPFGVPELALKPAKDEKVVVAPYASFLAAQVDPLPALENLHSMEGLGWSGQYGFFESADYSQPGAEVIRSWMAHHQGMSLLAICNVLFENAVQRYFHAEPQVAATELLLHERFTISTREEPERSSANSDALVTTG